MILHLVNDEKIINRTIGIYENVFPGENVFIVFRNREFDMVQNADNVLSYKEYQARAEEFPVTSVIIHFMTNRKIKFINTFIKKDVPIYWVMWGQDLYDRLVAPKGYSFIDTESSHYKQGRLKRFFTSIIKIPNEKVRIARRISFVKKRVKYIVTSTIENDYDILVSYYPELKRIQHKEMSYYPIDEVIGGEMIDMWATGNKIQLGHAGTLSNNHEYGLRLLSKFSIEDREIIMPLSYSGTKEYKDAVVKKGEELFGNNLVPITNFMPLADYNELMRSCSVAIYAYWRQEAVGNILVSLYIGTKVFLSNKGPMLQWGRNHGFVVFELEKMTQSEIDTPLDQESRQNNRNILLRDFSSAKLHEMMVSSFAER